MYRILIVEDDESIARSVKTHLESWNYEVCCAEDFSNVAGTFAAFDPQLVLMDVKLPFFNGYHWCSEIRKVSKVLSNFLVSVLDVTLDHQSLDQLMNICRHLTAMQHVLADSDLFLKFLTGIGMVCIHDNCRICKWIA